MTLVHTTDVFGDVVTLSDSRWHGHILASRPELTGYLQALEVTIQRPVFVYQSETDAETRFFYSRGHHQGKYRNLYLKVVVSYSTLPATIRTAFFTSSVTGGKLLWIEFP